MYPNVSGGGQGQMLMVAPVTKSAIPRFLQVQHGPTHSTAFLRSWPLYNFPIPVPADMHHKSAGSLAGHPVRVSLTLCFSSFSSLYRQNLVEHSTLLCYISLVKYR